MSTKESVIKARALQNEISERMASESRFQQISGDNDTEGEWPYRNDEISSKGRRFSLKLDPSPRK